jgi:hypothetical protein
MGVVRAPFGDRHARQEAEVTRLLHLSEAPGLPATLATIGHGDRLRQEGRSRVDPVLQRCADDGETVGELSVVELHRRKELRRRVPEISRREPCGPVEVVPDDLRLPSDDAGPSAVARSPPALLEHALIMSQLEQVRPTHVSDLVLGKDGGGAIRLTEF